MIFDKIARLAIKSKANRRIQGLSKNIKEDKLKETRSFADFQDWMKSQDTKFRKYNRKTKQYEVVIPRSKTLKESKQYESFLSGVNEWLNTSRNVKAEKHAQKMQKKYRMSENVYNRLDLSGYNIGHYSSDDAEVKQAHLDEAINLYKPNATNATQRSALKDIMDNTDNYSIHEIYDVVANLGSIKGSDSFDFDADTWEDF